MCLTFGWLRLLLASFTLFFRAIPKTIAHDFFPWCLLLIALSNNNREGINISRSAKPNEADRTQNTKIAALQHCKRTPKKQSCCARAFILRKRSARERFQSRRVVYCKLYCHLSHISVFYSSETNDSGVSSLGNANANVQAKWVLWRLINFDGEPINLVDRMMPRSVGAQFTTLTLLTNMSVSSKCRPNIFGASPG